MASSYKRRHQRGPDDPYTIKYRGSDGKWKYKVGFKSKTHSDALGLKLETEAKLVREGLVDPRDETAREASKRPLAKHIEDYHAELTARGNCKEHCADTISLIRRLFAAAHIHSITAINADKVRVQLGRIAKARSASTANHAQRAVKSFTRWLAEGKKLKEDPLLSLRSTYNEEADRKRVRRALSLDDIYRLIDGTIDAPPVRKVKPKEPVTGRCVTFSGRDRAALYLVATITGFRRDEIRVLTPERFDLGDVPSIRLNGDETKDGLSVDQPIRKSDAETLRLWLADKEPGKRVFADMPYRTAEMLAIDLTRAGIPVKTIDGVVDFHALRVAYITHLGKRMVDPETLRILARHKKFETTQRYLRTDDETKRKAIEGPIEPEI